MHCATDISSLYFILLATPKNHGKIQETNNNFFPVFIPLDSRKHICKVKDKKYSFFHAFVGINISDMSTADFASLAFSLVSAPAANI